MRQSTRHFASETRIKSPGILLAVEGTALRITETCGTALALTREAGSGGPSEGRSAGRSHWEGPGPDLTAGSCVDGAATKAQPGWRG